MSGVPRRKPWIRDPDVCDLSRSVVLDLQKASKWGMDSIVELAFLDPVKFLDDDMQVQRLPVHKAEQSHCDG